MTANTLAGPEVTVSRMAYYPPSHLDDLARYGFVRVGHVSLTDPKTVKTDMESAEASKWRKSVYAIVFGDKIFRIGSSLNPLGGRWHGYERGITAYLNGARRTDKPRLTGCTDREAEAWLKAFKAHGDGVLYATIAPTVKIHREPVNVYMSWENYLLGIYKPPGNNSHFH
jgi:hypothetical protein